MIRDKRIQVLLVASVLAAAFIQWLQHESLNFAEVLGGALGLMLFPFLVATITKWIFKAFKKDFSNRAFLIAILVVWISLVLANIVVAEQRI